MNLVLFDLGGTLIDDPFEEVLQLIHPDVLAALKTWKLESGAASEFISSWRQANITSDHPFASHFLQEETWIAEALMHLHRAQPQFPVEEIPLLSLTLLKRYRELAAVQISHQPQLSTLRQLLSWLKSTGAIVGVASNDREFATRAMLTWARLAEFMEWVFTSEGLSRKYPMAEKPAPEFFNAVFSELKRPLDSWDHVYYVGDSEKNDIIPANALGIRTVRFVNRGNRKDATWLDNTTPTLAAYHCTERKQLQDIFREAFSESRGTSGTTSSH